MSLNFNELMLPVPRTAVFKMEGYHVWCGSVTIDDDGIYYLFFSRWPHKLGHNAWVTNSEVCYATSDNPLGPFSFKGITLRGSYGETWDADCIHNPTVIRIKGKYYLYYMGNKGNGEYWNHRNNQRIGVAVAMHPTGPWKRFDKPLIDVTPGSFDHLLTNNPTVAEAPDGRIIMVYKGVGDGILPKGGPVVCGVAIAENPLGPFVKQQSPIMVNPENYWSVEDPYIWYHRDRFYALVKDFQGFFTKQGKNTVALFESKEGIDWLPSENPFAFSRIIKWEDGVVQEVDALERPQLLLVNGEPKVLYCAVAEDSNREISYNIHIPLKDEEIFTKL